MADSDRIVHRIDDGILRELAIVINRRCPILLHCPIYRRPILSSRHFSIVRNFYSFLFILQLFYQNICLKMIKEKNTMDMIVLHCEIFDVFLPFRFR